MTTTLARARRNAPARRARPEAKTTTNMRKEQTIISWAETTPDGFDPDSHDVNEFGSRAEAKDFIVKTLAAKAEAIGTHVRPLSGDIMDMWNRKEGSFSFGVGDHTCHVHFLNVPGEYHITDDEIFSALDAFCNSGRSEKNFRDVAERITAEMHRHCQNELWKFVKHLIRAFSMGRFDERNAVAHDEASAIQGYIVMFMKR